ncbi:hypothetical protein D3C84_728540 [compost metagenome]
MRLRKGRAILVEYLAVLAIRADKVHVIHVYLITCHDQGTDWRPGFLYQAIDGSEHLVAL